MVRIMNIPGIMWASDILTEQRPIPMHEQKKKHKQGDFKAVLDAEMEKLKDEQRV